MGSDRILASLCRGWASGYLARAGILVLIMCITATFSQDQPGAPTVGLLCISNCPTCPVICAPPPPPDVSPPPPEPPLFFLPPQAYYAYQTPPPPPSMSSFSSAAAAPPPPPAIPSDYPNVPAGQLPPVTGPRDSSYPYYFFYTSKAADHIAFPALYVSFLLLLLFFHGLFLC